MLGRVTAMERSKGRKGGEEKWIQHYSSSHKILLVGEGDFSFSACLAKAFGSASNMVATSYDSKEMLPIKHWSSKDHLEELKGLGCMVLHDIDVRVMNQQPILKKMKFDRIVYNFPHAGHDPLLHEWNGQLIKRHKKLLSGFFQSASEMLTDGGEVHVSHRNDAPYNRWKLEKLAKRAGLVLKECVEFRKSDYPGYHNKRGGGIKSNQKFPLNESFTFKFSLRDCSTMQQSRTSTSGCDDISEALAYLKLESMSYNDSCNKERKATVETLGKRNTPLEGDIDQLKQKIDGPDSPVTKYMIERKTDLEMVRKKIANIPHTIHGLKSIVEDCGTFQGVPSYPPAKESEAHLSSKKMSEEEGKSLGVGGNPQHHHQHYRTFEGGPQPAIGIPQPIPWPGDVASAPPHYHHDNRYQAVPGYATVAGGRPVRESRLPCCGIGLGWFLFIIGFFLVAIPWGFHACKVAAVLFTVAIILRAMREGHDW
ncbi:uncharacterized protein LOC131257884 isoform X2 [Magnolia sinica]|uniref:uncharacterized protein LOC131257884 isoform X2 n=1 Tax=Magnolia sinica TaxID=86752 RepID=UPI00265985BF|nr:uncharacterized protein LOC131257884 isoform X2 [Magnolia sinica]